jgi:hypothetical protein
LRFSGLLISLGLIIEVVTMLWSHPTAFLAFLLLGGSSVAAGVLLYLFAIGSNPSSPQSRF